MLSMCAGRAAGEGTRAAWRLRPELVRALADRGMELLLASGRLFGDVLPLRLDPAGRDPGELPGPGNSGPRLIIPEDARRLTSRRA